MFPIPLSDCQVSGTVNCIGRDVRVVENKFCLSLSLASDSMSISTFVITSCCCGENSKKC